MSAEDRWPASRIQSLLDDERARQEALIPLPSSAREPSEDARAATSESPLTAAPEEASARHRFVDAAYRALRGRAPRDDEIVEALDRLRDGMPPSAWLASLREPGSAAPANEDADARARRAISKLAQVPGLRDVARSLDEALDARAMLPFVLDALDAMSTRLDRSTRALASLARETQSIPDLAGEVRMLAATALPPAESRLRAVEGAVRLAGSEVESLRRDVAAARAETAGLRAAFLSFVPPPLQPSLEVKCGPLLPTAKARASIPESLPPDALFGEAWYAAFESAFYDTGLVAAKQRIYVDHLDRELGSRHPFLDLGCGRGEFLRILRDAGMTPIGVDTQRAVVEALSAEGIEAFESDLIDFLERDTRRYAGISALQVVEHLTADRLDRLLRLAAERLVRGGMLIVETPNPLCPFALGQFHTDPTHVAPIPPDRMRFSIEAAGFEPRALLYQALVPGPAFYGPDPRTYYMDYAVLATRAA